MKTYLKRSARYLIFLILVWAVVIALLFSTGSASTSFGSYTDIFSTTNFLVLACAVIAISLLYPKMGYINKLIPSKLDVDKFEQELLRIDIVKVKSVGNVSYYRYKSKYRRFMVKFDDTFTVEFNEDNTIVDGNRVMIARVWTQIDYSIKK